MESQTDINMPLVFRSPFERQVIPIYKNVLSILYDSAIGYIATKGIIDLFIEDVRTSNILFFALPYALTRLINYLESYFLFKELGDNEFYEMMISRIVGGLFSFVGALGLVASKSTPDRTLSALFGFFGSASIEMAVNKLLTSCVSDEPSEVRLNLLANPR